MADKINVPDPIHAAVPFTSNGTPSGLSQFAVKQLSDTQKAVATLIEHVAKLNEKAGL